MIYLFKSYDDEPLNENIKTDYVDVQYVAYTFIKACECEIK